MLFLSNLKLTVNSEYNVNSFGDVLFLSNLKRRRLPFRPRSRFGDVLFLSNLKHGKSVVKQEVALEMCYF